MRNVRHMFYENTMILKFHLIYPSAEIGRCLVKGKGKGKAVRLRARSGPEGSRKLRFPDYMTTAQDGGKVVSLTTSGPQCDRKDYVNEKFQ